MDPVDFADSAYKLSGEASRLAERLAELAQRATYADAGSVATATAGSGSADVFLMGFTVFVLAVFVGYYVVWHVTPALHSPLMSVTNAISSVIVVGALIAAGPADFNISQVFGFIAVTLASINIFGGFIVTQRMLQMFRKKQR